MNIRSLTRGDGVVIGAAVLLFIASFLAQSGCNAPDPYCNAVDRMNAWDSLGMGLGVYMAGVIGAVLVALARLQPGGSRKIAGQDLGAFGTAVTVVVAWVLLWSLIDSGNAGAGLILGFLAAVVLAGGAIATPLVGALQAPLMPAPKPAAPQPYGAQPQGGYGYPGAQQPSYGGQPQPGGAQPYGGQPQAAQPQQAGQAQAQAPAGEFSPFWFAVPVPRPLYAEDGSPTPIAELAPGTWYLAVEQRGAQLVAQTQDGRRGVLQDTSGIQRG
ncbi:hypothetical protein AB0E88_25440 [Streptomyces sp. NPDC028635]|uniref:hypothetical protein n=1 Tax=Streptomyces sp. NPDC028635 TaxID=3154800 RepID=UPI0033D4C041